MQYKNVYIDISGTCNAKCPWCERGARKNGLLPLCDATRQAIFLDSAHFGSILDHLLRESIVSRNTIINLHNWGDPLLHPHFTDIIEELNIRQIPFSLSTNASLVARFKPRSFANARDLLFSMPGFSQSSYDRAHGFKFRTIVENIKTLVRNAKLAGFTYTPTLVYHLYRFNTQEIKQAMKFAAHVGLSFTTVPAMFNAFDMYFDYMSNTLDEKIMERARRDLFLLPQDQVFNLRPSNYVCASIRTTLAISADGQLNSGCCARLDKDDEYRMGDILTMRLADIHNKLDSHPTCRKCQTLGADFLCQSPLYQSALAMG